MYTKQETFDLVVKHLLEQGVPSFSDLGLECRYRLAEGGRVLKCAAGFLIPDDKYDPSYEGRSVVDVRIHELIASLGHDPYLVGSLQAAHDDASEADPYLPRLKTKLIEVANRYALSTAVLGS